MDSPFVRVNAIVRSNAKTGPAGLTESIAWSSDTVFSVLCGDAKALDLPDLLINTHDQQ
jgi:hypothetical protein